MRFFDRETYEEGFPSHSCVFNARQEDFGDKKRRTQQHPCDTFPTELSCFDRNGGLFSRIGTSSPIPNSPAYFGLPPPRDCAQSPNGHLLPDLPATTKDSVDRWVSQIVPGKDSSINPVDVVLEDLDDADTLAKNAKNGVVGSVAPEKGASIRQTGP